MDGNMTLEQIAADLRKCATGTLPLHVIQRTCGLLAAAIDTHIAEIAEAVRDDRQRLPSGWRVEVREANGLSGLCVFGPIGAFAVDCDTMHKSAIRGEVIDAFGKAMHNIALEVGSHD